MIRQRVLETLAAEGPLTVEELSVKMAVPRAILRSALTAEFYRQVEFDHVEYGRVTAWGLRPGALRVDGTGHYHAMP